MIIRQRGFRIGQRVRLHDPQKYGSGNALPPGWSDGEEVTIIHFNRGEGMQTEVFMVSIDSGWEEEHERGNWAGAP
jgi:hypothetical protein